MPLKHLETCSRVHKIHYSDPTSTREWIIWRTRDEDEVLAYLTFNNLPPAAHTLGGTLRYLREADLTEVRAGVWKYRASYQKDPNTVTIEINYTGGSKKMMQSLGLVNSYNCDTEVSGTSVTAIEDAQAALDALDASIPALETSIPVLATFIDTAYYAAVDEDVDTTVRLLCFDAIDAATNAKNYANEVLSMASLVKAAVQNTIFAAMNADATLAASSAASAQDHYDTAAAANATAASEAADAVSAAALAVSAASGGNAESIAAAAAATNAANSAEASVAFNANAVNTAIAAAADAATDLANAIATDNANGIPNLGTMINVTDRGVDGVEIEDEKCDITVTKTFVATTLASGYLETLRSMAPSKNNADYAMNLKGQIINFKAGELKYKNFTYRQEGDDSIQITFYLASSRNITEADDVTIGNSPAIVKEGWDYLSVFYVPDVDVPGHCKKIKPKAVYVHRVYEAKDFSLLQLGI